MGRKRQRFQVREKVSIGKKEVQKQKDDFLIAMSGYVSETGK